MYQLQLIWFAGVCIGAVLFLLALRGRRVDDHPLCGECDFDLTGRPAASKRCPECGADLTRPTAIVLGHRQPHRPGMVAAGVCVAVCLIAMASPLVISILNPQPTAQRDITRLLNQLSVVDVRTRQNAFAQLRTYTLHTQHHPLLREHAEKLMAYTGPLNPAELGFLNHLAVQGIVDLAAYESFLFARFAPEVDLVPSARPRDEVPIRVRLPRTEIDLSEHTIPQGVIYLDRGLSSMYLPRVSVTTVTLEVLDAGLDAVERPMRDALVTGANTNELHLLLPLPSPKRPGEAALTPGEARRVRVGVLVEYQVGPHRLVRMLETWHTLEVLDPRVEVLRPMHDAYLHRQVSESLRVSAQVRYLSPGRGQLDVRVWSEGKLAETVAGQAFLHYDDQQVPLGPVRLVADADGTDVGVRAVQFRSVMMPIGSEPDVATLVIVPDATVARQHLDTRRYLDMELHVPAEVKRSTPPTTIPGRRDTGR